MSRDRSREMPDNKNHLRIITGNNKFNSSKSENKDYDDDDDNMDSSLSSLNHRLRNHFCRKVSAPWSSFWNSASQTAAVAAGAMPIWTTDGVVTAAAATCLKGFLILTVALYILNQKHVLPKPLSAVVSQALFWPTLPVTASRRIGEWITKIDDTVIMGGAPFGFLNYPEKLYHEYHVRGVVNFCQEYQGPVDKYKKLGMKHLRLPTVDHFEPSTEDLMAAVQFIQDMEDRGQRVYVHCRAGHGRSAAAVLAWLLYKHPPPITADKNDDDDDDGARQLNRELCRLRNVRPTLWRQTNIMQFQAQLLEFKKRQQQQQQQKQKQETTGAANKKYNDKNDEDNDEDDDNDHHVDNDGVDTLVTGTESEFSDIYHSNQL